MIEKYFDIQFIRGRLVIKPLKDLTNEDLTPVKVVEEGNALSYILSLDDDQEERDGWNIKVEKNRYIGEHYLRFTYAQELTEKVAELEKEYETKLDMVERTFFDKICSVYGVTEVSGRSRYSNLSSFEEYLKEKYPSEELYIEAQNNLNETIKFKKQFC